MKTVWMKPNSLRAWRPLSPPSSLIWLPLSAENLTWMSQQRRMVATMTSSRTCLISRWSQPRETVTLDFSWPGGRSWSSVWVVSSSRVSVATSPPVVTSPWTAAVTNTGDVACVVMPASSQPSLRLISTSSPGSQTQSLTANTLSMRTPRPQGRGEAPRVWHSPKEATRYLLKD